MAFSTIEFSSKIKSKYPEYNEMPDDSLALLILRKYPEYRDKVDLGTLQAKFIPQAKEYGLIDDNFRPISKTSLADASGGEFSFLPSVQAGLNAQPAVPGVSLLPGQRQPIPAIQSIPEPNAQVQASAAGMNAVAPGTRANVIDQNWQATKLNTPAPAEMSSDEVFRQGNQMQLRLAAAQKKWDDDYKAGLIPMKTVDVPGDMGRPASMSVPSIPRPTENSFAFEENGAPLAPGSIQRMAGEVGTLAENVLGPVTGLVLNRKAGERRAITFNEKKLAAESTKLQNELANKEASGIELTPEEKELKETLSPGVWESLKGMAEQVYSDPKRFLENMAPSMAAGVLMAPAMDAGIAVIAGKIKQAAQVFKMSRVNKILRARRAGNIDKAAAGMRKAPNYTTPVDDIAVRYGQQVGLENARKAVADALIAGSDSRGLANALQKVGIQSTKGQRRLLASIGQEMAEEVGPVAFAQTVTDWGQGRGDLDAETIVTNIFASLPIAAVGGTGMGVGAAAVRSAAGKTTAGMDAPTADRVSNRFMLGRGSSAEPNYAAGVTETLQSPEFGVTAERISKTLDTPEVSRHYEKLVPEIGGRGMDSRVEGAGEGAFVRGRMQDRGAFTVGETAYGGGKDAGIHEAIHGVERFIRSNPESHGDVFEAIQDWKDAAYEQLKTESPDLFESLSKMTRNEREAKEELFTQSMVKSLGLQDNDWGVPMETGLTQRFAGYLGESDALKTNKATTSNMNFEGVGDGSDAPFSVLKKDEKKPVNQEPQLKPEDDKFSVLKAGVPESRANDPKVVEAAKKAWKEKGTDSPWFKKWFGESKVVDVDGKPLVVYHGAPDVRFVEKDGTFKTVSERYGSSEPDKRAFWFASSNKTALSYADDRRAFDYQNAVPGVIKAYIKLDNPLIIDGLGKEWREAQARGKTSDVISQAREGGYDGAIIRNVKDDYNNNSKTVPTDTYVVFSPNQIKSATGNRGTFDQENGDIRYSTLRDRPLRSLREQLNDMRKEVDELNKKKSDFNSSLIKNFGDEFQKASEIVNDIERGITSTSINLLKKNIEELESKVLDEKFDNVTPENVEFLNSKKAYYVADRGQPRYFIDKEDAEIYANKKSQDYYKITPQLIEPEDGSYFIEGNTDRYKFVKKVNPSSDLESIKSSIISSLSSMDRLDREGKNKSELLKKISELKTELSSNEKLVRNKEFYRSVVNSFYVADSLISQLFSSRRGDNDIFINRIFTDLSNDNSKKLLEKIGITKDFAFEVSNKNKEFNDFSEFVNKTEQEENISIPRDIPYSNPKHDEMQDFYEDMFGGSAELIEQYKKFGKNEFSFKYGKDVKSKKANEIAKSLGIHSFSGDSFVGEETKDGAVFKFKDGGRLNIYTDEEDGYAYIRSSDARSEGKKDGGGSLLYQAALTWIRNNKLKLMSDPAGITSVNSYIRRTANQISNIIRSNMNDSHISFHGEQGVKKGRDGKKTLENALTIEMKRVFSKLPDFEKYSVDHENGVILDEVGNEQTVKDIREKVNDDLNGGYSNSFGIGASTLLRAIITNDIKKNGNPNISVDKITDNYGSILYSLYPRNEQQQAQKQIIKAAYEGLKKNGLNLQNRISYQDISQKWGAMPKNLDDEGKKAYRKKWDSALESLRETIQEDESTALMAGIRKADIDEQNMQDIVWKLSDWANAMAEKPKKGELDPETRKWLANASPEEVAEYEKAQAAYVTSGKKQRKLSRYEERNTPPKGTSAEEFNTAENFNPKGDMSASRKDAFGGQIAEGEQAEKWNEIAERKIYDYLQPLKKVQERVTGTTEGGVVHEAMLQASRAQDKVRKVREAFFEPTRKLMDRAGLTLKEVDQYLYARHAFERNEAMVKRNPEFADKENHGGSGMSDKTARSILKSFEMDYPEKFKALQRIGVINDRMNAWRLQYGKSEGILSDEEALAYEAGYKHYVPLRGRPDEITGETVAKPGVGKGMQARKDEKRALGRKSLALNVTAQNFTRTLDMVANAERNKVGLALAKMIRENPDPEYWTIDKTPMKLVFDKKTGEARPAPDMKMDAPNEYAFYENGQRHVMRFHTAEGLRMASALKGMSEQSGNTVLKAVSMLNRLMAGMVTAYDPQFVFSNAARDAMTATITSAVRDDGKTATMTIFKAPKAAVAIMGREFGKNMGEWGKYYERFTKAGGKTAFLQMIDFNKFAENIESDLLDTRRSMANPKKAFKTLITSIERINTGIENGARLSYFRSLVDQGMPDEKAALKAKELTVNFERHGEEKWMNQLWMFFNTALQGTANFARLFTNTNTRKAALVAAGALVSVGAMNTIFNKELGGKDEESDEDYWDRIKGWERDRNLVFLNPYSKDGTGPKIPLPYEFSFFIRLGQEMADLGYGKNPSDAALSVVNAMISAVSPLGSPLSVEDGEVKNPIGIAIPTPLQPFADLAKNRDFSGRPIMPEDSPFGSKKPDSQKYFPGVNPIIRDATTWVNEFTGGSEFTSGKILGMDASISPESIEYIINAYTGGIGRLFQQTSGLVKSATTEGETVELRQIPFVRKFFRGDMGNDRADFKRIADLSEQKEAEYMSYLENGQEDRANGFEDENYLLIQTARIFKEMGKGVDWNSKDQKSEVTSLYKRAKRQFRRAEEIDFKLKKEGNSDRKKVMKNQIDSLLSSAWDGYMESIK